MDVSTLNMALEEIKLRYPLIGVISAPKDDVMTCKPKAASKAPVSAHYVAMTDPRTVVKYDGDVMSVPGTLRNWHFAVSYKMMLTIDNRPDHTVEYYCTWLQRFLYAMPQDLLDELGSDMVKLRNQLREVTGEPNPRPFGYCTCNGPLYYTDGDPFVLCNSCGTMWDGYKLVEQLATLTSGQTLVTRATLVRWTGRSEHTIRARCTVVDYDESGRALYDAHDAQHALASVSQRTLTT